MRSLLALAPFLHLEWHPGCRHDHPVPETSRRLVHLVAKGHLAREVLCDGENFLIGLDGVFRPISTATTVDDLKRAALRQHLIDCMDVDSYTRRQMCAMIRVWDRKALISQISALVSQPIDYDISVEKIITILSAQNAKLHIIH